MELTDTLNNFAQRNGEILATKDKANFLLMKIGANFVGKVLVKIYLIYLKLMINLK